MGAVDWEPFQFFNSFVLYITLQKSYVKNTVKLAATDLANQLIDSCIVIMSTFMCKICSQKIYGKWSKNPTTQTNKHQMKLIEAW